MPYFEASCWEETRQHSSPAQYHTSGEDGSSIMLGGRIPVDSIRDNGRVDGERMEPSTQMDLIKTKAHLPTRLGLQAHSTAW